MQISYVTFIAIIKPSGLHSVGLHAIPAVHRKTVQFYCNKITSRSACSAECHSCLLHVKARLNTADWTTAQRPWGLYNWILKVVSAEVIEQAGRNEKSAPKFHPLDSGDTNILDIFMETLA
jgi:hypothetical protein